MGTNEAFCTQFISALEIYFSTYTYPLKRIFIFGDRLGLKAALQQKTSVPIYALDGENTFLLSPHLDKNYFSKIAPKLFVAYGLALRCLKHVRN